MAVARYPRTFRPDSRAEAGTELSLVSFGSARADFAAIAGLRKALPSWAPSGTPGHFLKHADEQTVLAVAAVDNAIAASGGAVADCREWSIIAAPRFIGRQGGAVSLTRFCAGGASAVSPHTIPQHSLHSISGALSILLQSRQANFGAGGAEHSLAEGLFAALAFPGPPPAGIWLVATAFDPEPQLDLQARCTNSPVCYAAALALQTGAGAGARGHLRLETAPGSPARHSSAPTNLHAPSVPELIAALEQCASEGSRTCVRWNLPWGAALILETDVALGRLASAA